MCSPTERPIRFPYRWKRIISANGNDFNRNSNLGL